MPLKTNSNHIGQSLKVGTLTPQIVHLVFTQVAHRLPTAVTVWIYVSSTDAQRGV